MSTRIVQGVCMTLALGAMAGCSSQQFYAVGQEWQRKECNKVMDMQERKRCMSSTRTSYEDYKRDLEAARVNR